MIKTLRTITMLLALSFLAVVITPRAAFAQDTKEMTSGSQAEQKTEDFTYITPEGCSLSLLSRRSLQLYDRANDKLQLSRAATIYAETNIVQELGARPLDVGERVTVPYALVDRYATSSQKLSKQILALWQRYVSAARFNLSDIQTTTQVKVEAAQKEQDSTDTSKTDSEKNTEKSSKTKDAKQPSSNKAANESNNNLWWALLIGAAIYAAWVINNRRRQADSE